MIKLYHVSFDLSSTDNSFVPRVPVSAADDEDKVTPRICLSDTVEGCMAAIGPGDRYIAKGEKFILRTAYIPLDHPALLYPNDIVERVPDALENNEYWFLEPIVFDQVSICEIESFGYEHSINWTCIKIEDVRKIVSKYIPDMDVNAYDNARNLYSVCAGYLNSKCMYNELDELDEEVVMLPWAQGLTLRNLKYKILEV